MNTTSSRRKWLRTFQNRSFTELLVSSVCGRLLKFLGYRLVPQVNMVIIRRNPHTIGSLVCGCLRWTLAELASPVSRCSFNSTFVERKSIDNEVDTAFLAISILNRW